jgi:hypothetical protein
VSGCPANAISSHFRRRSHPYARKDAEVCFQLWDRFMPTGLRKNAACGGRIWTWAGRGSLGYREAGP